MPLKMNMFMSNGNFNRNFRSQINNANLASAPGSSAVAIRSAPNALNAPIISRINNARPGCGSCGRH
jgi:hypothetical protein